MNPIPSEAKIRECHARYVDLSGHKIEFSSRHRYRWEIFLVHFGIADMELLVNDRLKSLRKHKCTHWHLRFGVMFERPIGEIEDDVAALEAIGRKPSFSHGKRDVLAATGRVDTPPDKPVRTAKELAEQNMRNIKAFAVFQAWKKENFPSFTPSEQGANTSARTY